MCLAAIPVVLRLTRSVIYENLGTAERSRSSGLENKFLDYLCWRSEHMQKNGAGNCCRNCKFSGDNTSLRGGAFHPRFFVSLLLLPLREVSASCVFFLAASSLFPRAWKISVYATLSSTLASLKPVVPWEKLSFCLLSALQHTYKHLHHPSGYENAKGTWPERFIVFVEL